MAHVVQRAQQVWAPVGLQIHLLIATIHEFVLVAVEEVCLRVRGKAFHIAHEQVGLYDVIMVKEAHEVTLCPLDPRVGVADDAPVRIERHHVDALIAPSIALGKLDELPVVGGSDHQDELEPPVGLCQNGFDHLPQIVERRVIEGHDYREEGTHTEPSGRKGPTLSLELPCLGPMALAIPLVIDRISVSREGQVEPILPQLLELAFVEGDHQIIARLDIKSHPEANERGARANFERERYATEEGCGYLLLGKHGVTQADLRRDGKRHALLVLRYDLNITREVTGPLVGAQRKLEADDFRLATVNEVSDPALGEFGKGKPLVAVAHGTRRLIAQDRVHLRATLCPVVGNGLMQLVKKLPRKIIRPHDEPLRGLRKGQDQHPTINARRRRDDTYGQLVCADKG